MTDAQKEAVKAKHLSDKIQKKRGVSKTVTISEEPATPKNAGTEFGKSTHNKKAKK